MRGRGGGGASRSKMSGRNVLVLKVRGVKRPGRKRLCVKHPDPNCPGMKSAGAKDPSPKKF